MTHGLDASFLVALEVASHKEHVKTRAQFSKLLKAGDTFSLAPQTLAEFIHVITDPRRFESPLSSEAAVERASLWWNATEIVHVFQTPESTLLFLAWLEQYELGRKRLLDTLLASTMYAAGITSVLTLNADDFALFKVFVFSR